MGYGDRVARVALCYNSKNSQDTWQQAQGDSFPDDWNLELDEEETISAIEEALKLRYDVVRVEADTESAFKFILHKPQFVFNIAEGVRGLDRESQIPAILEMLGIPYLGSSPLTLALCLDKRRAKEVLLANGVAVPAHKVFSSCDDIEYDGPYPCIVKPLREGSSMGIRNDSMVRTWLELYGRAVRVIQSYKQPVLVEEFLEGREFTVAVMGNGNEAAAMPIIEIMHDVLPQGANPIYSYEAKWVWDTIEKPLQIFECPAKLDAALKAGIEDLCLRAYRVLECRDWCRVDVRLDSEGVPRIIEMNPLPGILPRPENNSCFPKAARAAGMSYQEMILRVTETGMKRCGLLP